MHGIPRLIQEMRPSYAADADLLRTVMNSTSWVEANLATTLACVTVSERHLVAAANIREAIKELPQCPLAMALDFETLARVWGLTRVERGWEHACDDPDGAYTIVLLGEGNYCYDIVVRVEGRTLMWMPFHSEDDFLNPDIVDLIFERTTLLPTVIGLTEAMGLPFSPLLYLSVEDWRQEYAETMFTEAVGMFNSTQIDGDPLKERISGIDRLRLQRSDKANVTWLG